MKIRELKMLLGIVGLFSTCITFYIIWFMAFFNGYELTIAINNYNEAYVELVLLLFFSPFILYLIWFDLDYLKYIIDRRKKDEKKKAKKAKKMLHLRSRTQKAK